MDANAGLITGQKLDLEFRGILQIIKPYIPYINNNYYLSKYRQWLEKLSSVEEGEKRERNVYLNELSRQIQAGVLEEPFSEDPPYGRLPPFRKYQNQLQSSPNLPTPRLNQQLKTLQEPIRKQQYVEEPICERQYLQRGLSPEKYPPQKEPFKGSYPQKHHTRENPLQETVKENHQKNRRMRNNFGKKTEYEQPNHHHHHNPNSREVNVYYMQKMKEPPPIQNQQNYRATKEWLESEESSWCDLTEVSGTTMTIAGSGDSERTRYEKKNIKLHEMYDNKIDNLMGVIQNLKQENVQLKLQVEQCQKDLSLRNTKAETSIHNLAGEVECLKIRLKELIEIKTALKDKAEYSSVDYRKKACQLEDKLIEVQQNNAELKATVENLQNKIKELEMKHQNEKSTLKNKIAQLHEKEIEMLKQVHLQKIKSVENNFEQKVVEMEHEFNAKTEEIRQNFQAKVTAYESTIKEKDIEIARLENLVEKQCSRMQKEVYTIRTQIEDSATIKNEGYVDKIIFLQKCIAKMDKLYKKAEKDYQKQVAKLKREIELRDKNQQIQLTTQRAELIANSSSRRQNEVDSIINNLEERYKILLESQQTSPILNKDSGDNNDKIT